MSKDGSDKTIATPNQTAILTEKQVIDRLRSVDKDDVTDELYDFGKMMVDDALDRLKSIETKGTWIAAYSIGLITILVSIQAKWPGSFNSWAVSAMALSAAVAFAAAATAASALSLKGYPFFSHNEWIRSEFLTDARQLRQHHIVAMHGVHSAYREGCNNKASRIGTAQSLLLLAAILLVFALGVSVAASFAPI